MPSLNLIWLAIYLHCTTGNVLLSLTVRRKITPARAGPARNTAERTYYYLTWRLVEELLYERNSYLITATVIFLIVFNGAGTRKIVNFVI